MSGFTVGDMGDTVTIHDPSGEALAFRFEPLEDGDEASPVQYLGPGSRPLERILHDLRQRGRIVKLYSRKAFNEREIQGELRQWLSADRPAARFSFSHTRTSFAPTLILNLKVAFTTDEKWEELHSLSVNMRTGELGENCMAWVLGMEFRSTRPLTGVQRRRISMRAAFEVAKRWLHARVAQRDPTWVSRAQERLSAEVKQLHEYYSDTAADAGETAEKDEQRRLAEQQANFRPRVVVELVNVGIVYVPSLSFSVVTEQDGHKETHEVVVDGITGERKVAVMQT